VDPLWRLSIATIERDGAFSDFSGYDRTIVPISGNGVELTIDAKESIVLDKPYGAYSFRGEERVTCRLIDGPVRDFNIMTRREAYRHEVVVTECLEGLLGDAEMGFALLLQGSLAGANTGDTLWLTGSTALQKTTEEPILCLVARLFRLR
jgi:environmental stress-induced protein Ves